MYPQTHSEVINAGIAEALGQMQAYEIPAAEDRRTRYLFFGGDTSEVPGPGGMRVQSPCVPRRTLYRCMVTPVVTVRRLELRNLIPEGATIPGSENRVAPGTAEYWLHAGPEVAVMMSEYGSGTDSTRNWGLVELAPQFLRGKEWDEVKEYKLQEVFFPGYPQEPLPDLNTEVINHLRAKIEEVKTTDNALIAKNRELYLAVGQDMLRAVEAAQNHQEWICTRTNHAVAQPRGDEAYKPLFDARDEVAFKRSGMIKNTQALQRVAEEMKNGVQRNALDPDTLKSILTAVVPAQQPAFTPQMLAEAMVLANQMMQQAQEEKPTTAPKPRNANVQRQSNSDSPAS